MRTQKSILAHISVCSLIFLRRNYSNNLPLFKIVINIGVYLLYYILGHESIPSIVEDCDSPYEKIQKSPPFENTIIFSNKTLQHDSIPSLQHTYKSLSFKQHLQTNCGPYKLLKPEIYGLWQSIMVHRSLQLPIYIKFDHFYAMCRDVRQSPSLLTSHWNSLSYCSGSRQFPKCIMVGQFFDLTLSFLLPFICISPFLLQYCLCFCCPTNTILVWVVPFICACNDVITTLRCLSSYLGCTLHLRMSEFHTPIPNILDFSYVLIYVIL